MSGSDAIDLLPGQIAFLGELRRRMPRATHDPLTRLLPGRECLDRLERFRDRLRSAHVDDIVAKTSCLEVSVSIDQSGNDGLAGHIEHARPSAGKRLDRCAASGRENLSVPDGDRLGHGRSFVQRQHLSVDEDEVRRVEVFLLGCRRCSASEPHSRPKNRKRRQLADHRILLDLIVQ